MPVNQVKAPKVFGVLSIIFGSLMSLFCILGVIFAVGTRAAEDMVGNHASQHILSAVSRLYNAFVPVYILFIIFSVFLIVVGIGQVQYKKWSGQWSARWSVLSLLALIIISAYMILHLGNVYIDYINVTMAMGSGRSLISDSYSGIVGTVLALFQIIFYAPYPVLMLVFFRKQRIAESLVY